MRKHFLILMLMAMLPFAGFAQELTTGNYIAAGNFIYKVLSDYVPGTPGTPGTVSIEAIRAGKNPVDTDGKLNLLGFLQTDIFEDHYEFNVVKISAGALQRYGTATTGTSTTFVPGAVFDHIVDVKSVVIPKQFTTIEAGTFVSFTNISSITFEAESQLALVESHAFTTTQTKVFDFTPCTKLYNLADEAFVEAGLTNTYITTIKLPDHSADPTTPTPTNFSFGENCTVAGGITTTLGTALSNLPSLTTIVNLDKCNLRQISANAFNGDASLESLEVPATVGIIKDNAFQNSGIKYLTVNVESLNTFGDGTTSVYGATPEVLETLTLKGVLNCAINTNAFKGCVNLVDLDLTAMSFKPTTGSTATTTGNGNFATNSFQNCTSLAAVVLPTLQGSANPVIAAGAFAGCTSLATVGINGIKCVNMGVGSAAFGNALKTVTIGTIQAKATGNVIATGAFVYGDVAGATLKIAQGATDELKNTETTAPVALIGNAAFDFSAISVTPDREDADYASVMIGKISSGNIFADGALKGDQIISLEFTGAIANGGLVGFTKPIVEPTAPATPTYVALKELTFKGNLGTGTTAATVIGANAFADLTNLQEITFDGDIIPGAIATNAFANLTHVAIITFNGDLKASTTAGAVVLAGAFEDLPADSEIHYTKNGATTAYNPFALTAFDATATIATPRNIVLVVTDATLAGKYADGANGLGSGNAWDIFRVIYEAAPVVSATLDLYRNNNEATVAWARNPIIPAVPANFVSIQRVQDIENEGDVKLTLYQTYTDEDPFDEQSTIYMLPLQAYNGVYYIPNNTLNTIIAKAQKKDGTAFAAPVAPATVATVKFAEVEITTLPTGAASSIWKDGTDTGNRGLHKAANIMTNQQLVDGTAMDGAFTAGAWLHTAIDGTPSADIERDIYILTDPSKGNGIRIDKMPVTSTNSAYINTGWWYWMLAKFDNASAAARVIWLGEDDDVTAILNVKNDAVKAENDALYTLQGVRVNTMEKGRIYIKNGKKFIAQ